MQSIGDGRLHRPYIGRNVHGDAAIFGPSLRDGVCYTPENYSRKQIVPLLIEQLN